MTKRLIVYYILDAIKSVNTDSYIVEEHVLFLMNAYRAFLVELKKRQDKLFNFSDDYYQEICIDLELTEQIEGLPCGGYYLKSVLEIPSLTDKTNVLIYPYDYFNKNITYISRDRFKYVGYNKFMQNIIYATLGVDNHLYIKSNNPLYQYLEKVRLAGVFDDEEKAEELSCDKDSEDCADSLDKDFAIPLELVPQMIEMITQLLLKALYSPADLVNDSRDTIADLMLYIRRNMKNGFLKLIEA